MDGPMQSRNIELQLQLSSAQKLPEGVLFPKFVSQIQITRPHYFEWSRPAYSYSGAHGPYLHVVARP